jgi:hypothetical protein
VQANDEDILGDTKETLREGFYTFIPYCLMERPHIWSADKHKRLEKSQFVEDLGDVGYGVGSVSV